MSSMGILPHQHESERHRRQTFVIREAVVSSLGHYWFISVCHESEPHFPVAKSKGRKSDGFKDSKRLFMSNVMESESKDIYGLWATMSHQTCSSLGRSMKRSW